MTTAYERILDKLEGVKRNGNKANARWPAHPDRNTSLSLRAIEGSVLLWCFVCEDNDKVLAALKSTSADLYDNRRGATYQYEDGRNVHRTHVNGTKDFPQTGNTSGQPTLYRLSKVKEAVKRGDAILLVEGDKDVHALESIGVTATTAPMGAGNIDKCDLSPLNGGLVTAIVDKPKDDNDTTGEQWARHLRRALTDKANIEFKQAKVGKDAADHIAAQFGVEDFVPYVFPVNPLLAGKRNAVWLKQQRFDPLQWIVPKVIPEGFTLLVGAPKIGKSWMALSVALAVASGGVAFGGIPVGDPRPVLLIAPEDSDRRMQDCIRKLWPDGHGSWPPYLDYFTEIEPGQVIATINAWLEELPPNTKPLVILDTVGKILPRELPGESQYQRDYRISGLLKRVCDQRRGTGLIGLPRPKVNRRRLCSHNLQHPRSRRGS